MVRHQHSGVMKIRTHGQEGGYTWRSRGEVKAWAGFCHVLRASPGCVVIIDIADLPCEGQVSVVVLHKVVSNPAQTVQRCLGLSSCCIPLQGETIMGVFGRVRAGE